MSNPNPLPKEPHAIEELIRQIETHAYFNDLSGATRFVFWAACGGYSWTTEENNACMRKIWRFLYLGVPDKDVS